MSGGGGIKEALTFETCLEGVVRTATTREITGAPTTRHGDTIEPHNNTICYHNREHRTHGSQIRLFPFSCPLSCEEVNRRRRVACVIKSIRQGFYPGCIIHQTQETSRHQGGSHCRIHRPLRRHPQTRRNVSQGPHLVLFVLPLFRGDSSANTCEHEPTGEEPQTYGVHGCWGLDPRVKGVRYAARVSLKVVDVGGQPIGVDERVPDHECGRRREHCTPANPVRRAVESLPRCRMELPRGECTPHGTWQGVRQRWESPQLVIFGDERGGPEQRGEVQHVVHLRYELIVRGYPRVQTAGEGSEHPRRHERRTARDVREQSVHPALQRTCIGASTGRHGIRRLGRSARRSAPAKCEASSGTDASR
mmetsp:Transcript_3671/g.13726  ORF Transcript_3671/g.13726 Transcript_3671/m.13726 type:complete len:363 (+) Transcript_3671:3776-4864(+)